MELIVKYVGLKRSYEKNMSAIDSAIKRVMMNGSFILRNDVEEFEKNITSYLHGKFAIGVNSGTDALYLSCKAAGIAHGDEVITVGHTFVATIAAIHHCGAKAVLIDIGDDFNIDVEKIQEKITKKTKAIIPVHLNGRACNMDKIMSIAKEFNLIVIEDACQSVGAKFNNQHIGTFGEFGCFSLHPMKSLNCAGDGGYIITNNEKNYNKLRLLRNHGQSDDKQHILEYGYNSRLDNLQAAIANIRLADLETDNNSRRNIAKKYMLELSQLPIVLPKGLQNDNKYYDVYNSFVIRVKDRDNLYKFLLENGIEVFVHMAKPLSEHLSLGLDGSNLLANKEICNEIISLPIYPELKDEEVNYVISKIKAFYK